MFSVFHWKTNDCFLYEMQHEAELGWKLYTAVQNFTLKQVCRLLLLVIILIPVFKETNYRAPPFYLLIFEKSFSPVQGDKYIGECKNTMVFHPTDLIRKQSCFWVCLTSYNDTRSVYSKPTFNISNPS